MVALVRSSPLSLVEKIGFFRLTWTKVTVGEDKRKFKPIGSMERFGIFTYMNG